MTLAYKDITGGPWKVYTQKKRDGLFYQRATLAEQYAELVGLGNVIIGTARGSRITRRTIRYI